MKCSVCRSCRAVRATASRVYVISGSSKSGPSTHLPSKLEASLPFMCLASKYFRLVLRLILIVEREIDVPLQSVPYALPYANPFIRGSVVSRHTATSVDPCCRSSRVGTPAGCRLKKRRVFHAALAVPSAASRHLVEAGTEDVAKLLATVTEHELRCVAKLIADHACVIASVVLECVVVVDDHRRIDIGNLLLVFYSILG